MSEPLWTWGKKVWLPRAINREDSAIGTWWRVGNTVVVRCPFCGAGQHLASETVKPPVHREGDALNVGSAGSITCVGVKCRRDLHVMLDGFFSTPPEAHRE